ncbi:hypothetical protein B0H14DRAFT_2632839 [Mycena olivaceomarginata]|nr:hypothetical protein B0H14DRAFT_2632839 [Mycena olivaceomarginata]
MRSAFKASVSPAGVSAFTISCQRQSPTTKPALRFPSRIIVNPRRVSSAPAGPQSQVSNTISWLCTNRRVCVFAISAQTQRLRHGHLTTSSPSIHRRILLLTGDRFGFVQALATGHLDDTSRIHSKRLSKPSLSSSPFRWKPPLNPVVALAPEWTACSSAAGQMPSSRYQILAQRHLGFINTSRIVLVPHLGEYISVSTCFRMSGFGFRFLALLVPASWFSHRHSSLHDNTALFYRLRAAFTDLAPTASQSLSLVFTKSPSVFGTYYAITIFINKSPAAYFGQRSSLLTADPRVATFWLVPSATWTNDCYHFAPAFAASQNQSSPSPGIRLLSAYLNVRPCRRRIQRRASEAHSQIIPRRRISCAFIQHSQIISRRWPACFITLQALFIRPTNGVATAIDGAVIPAQPSSPKSSAPATPPPCCELVFMVPGQPNHPEKGPGRRRSGILLHFMYGYELNIVYERWKNSVARSITNNRVS